MARVEEDDLGADIEKGSGSVRTIEKVVNDLDDKYCPMWAICFANSTALDSCNNSIRQFYEWSHTNCSADCVFMFATAILRSIISFVLQKSKRK